MAALLGAEIDQARAICAEAATDRERRARGGRGRQRQWRRPGGDLRRQGRGRARHRDRQGEGHQARHAAAGLRALPLRADGARRRRDGARRSPARRCSAPLVPVVANVTAAPATDPETIRDLLVEQVTGTVRWRECVAAMAAMAATVRRMRLGQGADRADEAQRAGGSGHLGRHAGRCRGLSRLRLALGRRRDTKTKRKGPVARTGPILSTVRPISRI